MSEMEDFFKADKPPKVPKRKDMGFEQAFDNINLSPVGDIDKDGVPNWDDCKPFDGTKDGWLRDKLRRKEETLPSSEFEDLKQMDKSIQKAPVKKTLLQKMADNRAKQKATKEYWKAIYMEEYNKKRAEAIKARAKQEAWEKHRPTRKQKIDSALKGFENLGLAGLGQPSTSKPEKTGKDKKGKGKKPKFAVVGGKAYPIAGTSGKKKTSKTKKKQSEFDIDFNIIDDIGDFDF